MTSPSYNIDDLLHAAGGLDARSTDQTPSTQAAAGDDAFDGAEPTDEQWQLLETDHPFVLGLSPLLGIHSWLQPQPPTDPVVLEQTELGRGALLQNPVALSPHHAAPPTSNRGAS